MRKPMSQREAAEWRKRALRAEGVLHSQRHAWRGDWPDWPKSVILSRASVNLETLIAVKTARKLNHAVVVMADGNDVLFFACEVSA